MNSVLNKEIENTDTYLNRLGCKKSAQKVVHIEDRGINVHIFLEGHKILQNLHLLLTVCTQYCSQK